LLRVGAWRPKCSRVKLWVKVLQTPLRVGGATPSQHLAAPLAPAEPIGSLGIPRLTTRAPSTPVRDRPPPGILTRADESEHQPGRVRAGSGALGDTSQTPVALAIEGAGGLRRFPGT